MAEESNSNKDASKNKPVVETVPVEEVKPAKKIVPEKFVPEEIPEETPEDLTLSDIGGIKEEPARKIPTIDMSSFGGGGNLRKYMFLGLGVVGVILVFIVIFTGILSLTRGKKKVEAVTLEYWGLWEDAEVMKPLIEDYMRDNPHVTINYTKEDPRSYRDKLVTRGKEGRGPDIFRFHNTWLPSVIEIAAPLPQSIMSNEEFQSTFYDVAQDDLFVENAYYGLPLGIDGLVLVYNGELFKRAGLSSAPKTWDDVLIAADTLRVQDADKNILTSGISLGTSNNIEHFSDIFAWMLLQNGGDIRNLAAPESVAVLTNYRQFAEPQLNFWNDTMPNNISAFIQGKVAMIIVPSWQILEILIANPELDVQITTLPVLPGTQAISYATYWVEGVSKTSANQEEAWKFLKYLTEKDTMTKMYQEQTKVRPFGVAYSRVDLRDTLLPNEYIGPVLEQAPNMRSLPMAWRTYDNGMNDEIVSYIGDAVNATQKGVSYQQALDIASVGVTNVLAKYNIQ